MLLNTRLRVGAGRAISAGLAELAYADSFRYVSAFHAHKSYSVRYRCNEQRVPSPDTSAQSTALRPAHWKATRGGSLRVRLRHFWHAHLRWIHLTWCTWEVDCKGKFGTLLASSGTACLGGAGGPGGAEGAACALCAPGFAARFASWPRRYRAAWLAELQSRRGARTPAGWRGRGRATAPSPSADWRRCMRGPLLRRSPSSSPQTVNQRRSSQSCAPHPVPSAPSLWRGASGLWRGMCWRCRSRRPFCAPI